MSKRTGIGLLGGTFDPIHQGHVQLALSVYHALHLEAIHFISAAQPLLRDQPKASETDRLNMVKLVTDSQPFFKLDDREMRRGGDSYMIDTLAEIRMELPDTPLCLIVGVDQCAKLDQWKDWRNIPNFAHIIMTSRKGVDFSPNSEVEAFISRHQTDRIEDLHTSSSGRVFLLPVDVPEIASTEIREQIQGGEDARNLLPQTVWEYICEKGLYSIG